jgi:ABC-type phosphate/phosphonate transport system substrate-binding protein
MTAVASLGMYDSSGLHAANDQLWQAIAWRLRRGGLSDVPDRLDRSRPLDAIWSDPALLLGQTCGYPLVTRFAARLRYVATPRYRAPGCEGITHRSRVVVRQDDPGIALSDYRGHRVAINDRGSNTGMNLLRALVAPIAGEESFFGHVAETGSHAASARSVAAGQADLAAIDVITFAHLQSEEPEIASALRTLAWTPSSPGLPFVTAATASDDLVRRLRKAIRSAIADEVEAAARLLLDGIENIGAGRYEMIQKIEAASRRRGYSELA